MYVRTRTNVSIFVILLALSVSALAQGTNPYLPNPPVKRKATDSISKLNPLEISKAGKPTAPGAVSGKSARRQSTDDHGWEFTVTPYAFFAGLEGTYGARGKTINLNDTFGTSWHRLNFGIMGAIQARRGRFLFTNDFQWHNMSEERTATGTAAYRSFKARSKLMIWDPEVGIRLASGKAGTLDLTGGVRVWSVGNSLETTAGTSAAFSVSQRRTWAAPVIGVNGTLNLSRAFYLASRVDVGGGFGVDSTTQFYGGAGIRFTSNFALIGGWRYQQVKYDDNNGFTYDTNMQGPVLGARFIFR